MKLAEYTVVTPKDRKGKYTISITVRDGYAWIDAFSDHSEDPAFILRNEWVIRGVWEQDTDPTFLLETDDESNEDH